MKDLATVIPKVPGGIFAPDSADSEEGVKVDCNVQLLDSLISPRFLTVKRSPFNGYGVFAEKSFEKGDVIEEAPFVRTDFRSKDLVQPQVRQCCFTLPCGCDECKFRGKFFVFASGFVQIYNHSDGPDVGLVFMRNERVIRVIAEKDIIAGQEIFVSYGKSYDRFDQVAL